MACTPTQPEGHWQIQGGCFLNDSNNIVTPIQGVDVYGSKPHIRSYLPFQYYNEGCYNASHSVPWKDEALSAMFVTTDPFIASKLPAVVTKYEDTATTHTHVGKCTQ